MSVKKNEIQEVIQNSFPEAEKIIIKDLGGDENHYSLEIHDQIFAGKTLIKQHRMVKAALTELLQERLHAITIKTKF